MRIEIIAERIVKTLAYPPGYPTGVSREALHALDETLKVAAECPESCPDSAEFHGEKLGQIFSALDEMPALAELSERRSADVALHTANLPEQNLTLADEEAHKAHAQAHQALKDVQRQVAIRQRWQSLLERSGLMDLRGDLVSGGDWRASAAKIVGQVKDIDILRTDDIVELLGREPAELAGILSAGHAPATEVPHEVFGGPPLKYASFDAAKGEGVHKVFDPAVDDHWAQTDRQSGYATPCEQYQADVRFVGEPHDLHPELNGGMATFVVDRFKYEMGKSWKEHKFRPVDVTQADAHAAVLAQAQAFIKAQPVALWSFKVVG